MNKKTLFLVITFTAMLILVTSVNATNDNTNTSTTHSISEKTTTTEPVVKEKIQNTPIKEKTDKTQEKTITKTNKTRENTKKDSIIIDGITYEQIIENEDVEIEVIEDATYFNKCTFNNEAIEIYQNVYINNSTINSVVYFENEEAIINNSDLNCIDGLMGVSSLIIENSVINGIVNVYGNKEVRNSTINHKFYADPETYIYDVILGKNGQFIGNVIGEPLDPSIKIDVNNLEELTNTINTATNDIENEYTINLNEGIYTGTTQTWNEGDSTQKITINGNNQSINIDSQLNINSKNTIIIKNLNLNTTINNNNPDLTIQDSTLQKEINNYNTLTLNNTKTNNDINNDNNLIIMGILNSTINNQGTLIIDKNTIIGENYQINGNGTILTNATQTINGNQTITNKTFQLGITIPTTGNITFVDCNISALIKNNGNVTLVNCSFSNNNMTASASMTDGFLVSNLGNLTMIGCTMENNTFDGPYGAMVNNGFMSIINCTFDGNRYVPAPPISHPSGASVPIRDGAVVTNKGTLVIDNSSFSNGFAPNTGGAINNSGNLMVNNSEFVNNTVHTAGSAIYNYFDSHCDVYNTLFLGNYVNLTYAANGVLHGGGAIADSVNSRGSDNVIFNCTFKDNRGEYTPTEELVGVSGSGGALLIGFKEYVIEQSTFINNDISCGKAYYVYPTNTSINNCTFENSEILDRSGLDITNSIFKGNSGISKWLDDNYPNKKIIGNNFTDNTRIVTTYNNGYVTVHNTISLIAQYKQEALNYSNLTIKDNIYHNTSINDEIIIDVPDNVYSGEAITFTGIYNLLEPENYDSDILEQNQFNVYVNDELYQTVDTLEFTITPTSDNMRITIQPTISQTRKTILIRPITINFTLEDVTATIGETAQLTAQITLTTDGDELEVNTGRVYFKVNGKILRDTSNGRILYVDVSDNTATLDYNVPKTWNDETTIEAVFTGNDEIPQKTSNTVNPSITTPEAQETEFSVADTTATAGSEVTITVTTKNLDAGKVVLKVNGKTVKASDGKLYAKTIGDATIVTYTVPKTLKAGDYSIKAVYTSGATRLEVDGKLSVE